MAWYDIPGVSCVFALDYNSEVIETNSKVFYSNNPSKSFSVEGLENKYKIFKTESLALDVENFKPVGSQLTGYNCLKVIDSNLLFDQQELFSDVTKKVTFILKTKLNSSSGFLNCDLNSSNFFGLTYTDTEPQNNFWRFSNVSENLLVPGFTSKDRISLYKSVFDTVVLRLDWGNRLGSITTTYGTFSLNFDSIFMDPNFFINTGVLESLGHSNADWKLDADIVAYGMFDDYLTEDQVAKCLEDIEGQFLISKSRGTSLESLKVLSDNSLKSYTIKSIGLKNFKVTYESEIKTLGPIGPKLEEFRPENFNFIRLVPEKDLDYSNSMKFNLALSNIKTTTNAKVFNSLVPQGNSFNLEGVILEEDIPAESIPLFLYDKKTGELLRKTLSGEGGVYTFLQLNKSLEYVITAYDDKYQYKSVIQDFNTQEDR